MRIWRSLPVLVLCLAPLGVTGCQKEEGITVQTVTHPDREPIRLLAAIAPREKEVLFFRLSGPAGEVAKQKASFDAFVASLRFDDTKDPKVTWKAPAGWKEEPGGGLRLATFRIPADPRPLELTVTPLGTEAGSILDNVNRWRKQITLPPLEPGELADAVKREKVDGQEVILVDMVGVGTHTAGKPAPPPAPLRKPAPSAPAPAGPAPPFTYDAPAGWVKQAPKNSFTSDVLVIPGYGESGAVFTLTSLPNQGGGVAANIDRWRTQLGMPKLGEAAAKDAAPVQLDRAPGYAVDLEGPKGDQPFNRIVGVILPLGEQTWFFKLTGPADLVGRHKPEFDALIQSVKLGAKR